MAAHSQPRTDEGPLTATFSLAAIIRGVIDRILFWAILGNLLIACLGWSVPALLLGRLLPRRLRAPAGQFTAMLWCRWFIWSMQATGRVRCDLSALDALRGEHGVIVVANHPCLLDALLVISRLPHVTCIAKAGLWNSPLLGAGIRLAGYVSNDSARKLLRDTTTVLRQPGPQQMLIFPEGTRSPSASIGAFRPGFAAIARRAGADVQTVLIETNSPYLGKDWPIFRMPQFPLVYRARLGKRFATPDNAQDFAASLEDFFREELAGRGLAALS